MKIFSASLILIFCLQGTLSFAQSEKRVEAMNNKRMGKILKEEVKELEGEEGAWQMTYGGRLLLVITDESANRMRIFSPVIEEEELKDGQLEKMLAANFHSALDAKYSLYEGYVVSVFTHPLRELTEAQFVDALRQVVVLNLTFGTTYQSTDMIFNPGGQAEEEGDKDAKEKEEKVIKS